MRPQSYQDILTDLIEAYAKTMSLKNLQTGSVINAVLEGDEEFIKSLHKHKLLFFLTKLDNRFKQL